MKPVQIEYFAAWPDVINVVCPDINEEAEKLGDLLDEKDIPFEYCIIDNEPAYDGKVALVLLGVDGIHSVVNADTVAGYVFDFEAAIKLIDEQSNSKLVFNGVNYVAVSDYYQKILTIDDFCVFCRSECENVSEGVDLLTDADNAAFKLYKLYEQKVNNLFAADVNMK